MKTTITLSLVIILLATGVFYINIWGQTETISLPQKQIVKTKVADVSPELREKAFGLLTEVIKEADNLKLPENRIELKIKAADLLWEKDEKQARKVFSDVKNEILKLPDVYESDNKSLWRYRLKDSFGFLLVEALIERDVVAAEQAFRKLKFNEDQPRTKVFVKDLFRIYLEVDQQRAYTISKDTFVGKDIFDFAESFNEDNFGELIELYKANPNLGSILASDIFELILTKKIKVTNNDEMTKGNNDEMTKDRDKMKESADKMKDGDKMNEGANKMADKMKESADKMKSPDFYKDDSSFSNKEYKLNEFPEKKANNPNELSFFKVSSFLKKADEFNTELKAQNPTQIPLISESKLQELSSILVNSLIDKPNFYYYEVTFVYPELNKYAPAQVQKLRRKMKPNELKKFDEIILYAKNEPYLKELNITDCGRNLNEILEDIKNSPVEKQDELYAEAIEATSDTNCCNCGEFGGGFEYYLRIQNKEKYPKLIETFDETHQLYKSVNGDVKELKKILAKEKDVTRKLELISRAAESLGKKGDLDSAKQLLAEAQKLLPDKIKTSKQLKANSNYVKALATFDIENTFLLIEDFVKQTNQAIDTSADFYTFWNETGSVYSASISIKEEEFLLYIMKLQTAKNIYPSANLIRKLAHNDFERAVGIANKFSRPEVRIFARWQIAEMLLNSEYDANEKEFADEPGMCG